MVGAMKVLYFSQALLPTGWAPNVRVQISENGLIESIGISEAQQTADERHAIGLPGVSNLHSHAFQRGMAGLAEVRGATSDSFWTWRQAMYRFVNRIGPDELQAIAALAYVEMLESGFTRVGEFHYLHHDVDGSPFSDPAEMSCAIAAAADQTGIGLTHLPVFYAHGGFGGVAPRQDQRRFVSSLDSYVRLVEGSRRAVASLPDANVGLAPHSLRAATAEQLAQLERLAGDIPIHIHIAEQTQEVDECIAATGARPVQWLLDHLRVDARWCLVHATHMTEGEISGLAQSKAVAGLCPITEANLGDGIFPAVSYLSAGGRFGVGSDSNVQIGMPEELRLLEYSQRLKERKRNVLALEAGTSTGEALFTAAVAGGAQALGAPAGISVGRPADIVSLDDSHPSLVGRGTGAIVDSLVFADGRSAIDSVWRRGRKIVERRRHVDRESVVSRYRQALKQILA